MDKKFVPSKVTDEESKQMTQMVNWMDDQEEIYGWQIRSYKQFSMEDKHYHTRFSLIVHKWENERHKHITADGGTLMEAMANLSEKMCVI